MEMATSVESLSDHGIGGVGGRYILILAGGVDSARSHLGCGYWFYHAKQRCLKSNAWYFILRSFLTRISCGDGVVADAGSNAHHFASRKWREINQIGQSMLIRRIWMGAIVAYFMLYLIFDRKKNYIYTSVRFRETEREKISPKYFYQRQWHCVITSIR